MVDHLLFNAADHLLDRHVREGRGDRIAVAGGDRTLTYAQLADRTHGVAAGFVSMGVRPEERVMMCMADGVELLTAILGAMRMGAVPVPVSTMATGAELGGMLADSRARVLCASVEFAAAAAAAVSLAPEVVRVVLDGPAEFAARPSVTVHQWPDVFTDGDALYETWADSPALWLYTSGTTGRPKGAIHRHDSIRQVATCYGSGVLGVLPGDRCLSVAKLFFAYGIGNSCFFPLAVGASTVLERSRPTPAVMAAAVRGHVADVVLRRAHLLRGPVAE